MNRTDLKRWSARSLPVFFIKSSVKERSNAALEPKTPAAHLAMERSFSEDLYYCSGGPSAPPFRYVSDRDTDWRELCEGQNGNQRSSMRAEKPVTEDPKPNPLSEARRPLHDSNGANLNGTYSDGAA